MAPDDSASSPDKAGIPPATITRQTRYLVGKWMYRNYW
jgi:hypothetical protein